MLVAVFNQTTSWSTRTIVYDEVQRRFILQDHGPIPAQKVLDHDAQGQLDWTGANLREWVQAFAEWERLVAPVVRGASQPWAQPVSHDRRPGSSRTRRLTRVAAVALVAVAVVGIVIHNGSRSPTGSTAAPPPSAVRIVTDPSVTMSPTIGNYVVLLTRADRNAYKAWTALNSRGVDAYTKLYQTAAHDERCARAVQPRDDGTWQWTLAHTYAVRVRNVLRYEDRAFEEGRAGEWTAEHKDFKALQRWARQMVNAHNTYYRYVSPQNWAGYTAIGRAFTSVTATWTQPRVYASGGTRRRVDIWVGLDGWTLESTTCEQTGIGIAQWSSDSTDLDYWAWYEMLPKPPVTIAKVQPLAGSGSQDLMVKAGDTVTATVTSLGDHRFRLTLVDSTQGKTFSVTRTCRTARCDSAEIIVESHLGRHMGLSDFDPVQFTKCAIDGQPISSFHLKKTHLAAPGDIAMTWTSALGDGGTSFTIERR